VSHKSIVPFKYLKICFTASQCVDLGFIEKRETV